VLVVSGLVVELFEDAGRHAQSAAGVNSLPLNTPGEVEVLVWVDPGERYRQLRDLLRLLSDRTAVGVTVRKY
jgi:hypothetical protein